MVFRPLLVRLVFVLIPAFAVLFFFRESSDDIVGHWFTEKDEAIVEIFKKEGLYFGKVTHLSEPLDKYGRPKTDRKNHDPNLRGRPQLGILILYELEYNPIKHRWDHGKVYIPSLGTEANVVLYLEKTGLLRLRAFIGNEKIGQTHTWTRKN